MFVLWKLEQYSQSTSILPLPVCAELTLEMEFFLMVKSCPLSFWNLSDERFYIVPQEPLESNETYKHKRALQCVNPPFTCTLSNRLSFLETKFLTQSNCSFMGSNQVFLRWKITLRSNLHLHEAKGVFLVGQPSSLLAISSAPFWKLLLGKRQLSLWSQHVSTRRESLMGHGILWENRREEARDRHVTVF